MTCGEPGRRAEQHQHLFQISLFLPNCIPNAGATGPKCSAEMHPTHSGVFLQTSNGLGLHCSTKKPSATTAAHPPARSSHSPPPSHPPHPFSPISSPKSAHNNVETKSSLLLPQTITPQSSGQAMSIHSTATPWALGQSLLNRQHL